MMKGKTLKKGRTPRLRKLIAKGRKTEEWRVKKAYDGRATG